MIYKHTLGMVELIFKDIFDVFFSMQIPEQFGPIRTVTEGKGDVILIGTTRNFVLQGTLSGDFTPITQVRSRPAGPARPSPAAESEAQRA